MESLLKESLIPTGFNSSCNQYFVSWKHMEVLPSVGLICGLKNSSIQMQNTPQNNYALSFFFQFTSHITPPSVLFSLHAHCSFTFAFSNEFAAFKYECIPHHTPTPVVSLQQLRLTPSTTPPFDCLASGISLEPAISPSVSAAGTCLYGHAHQLSRFTCPQQKRAGLALPSFYRRAANPLSSDSLTIIQDPSQELYKK